MLSSNRLSFIIEKQLKRVDGLLRVDLHDEFFYLEPKSNVIYVHIRQPYYRAGINFKWEGYSLGLGLSQDILLWAAKRKAKIRCLVGEVKDKCYEAYPEDWMKFAVKHRSIMERKKDGRDLPRIYVCKWDKEHFKTVKLTGQQELV